MASRGGRRAARAPNARHVANISLPTATGMSQSGIAKNGDFPATATGMSQSGIAKNGDFPDSQAVAATLQLPKRTVNLILHAAPMHDVGKIGIPDGILLKPGPLDEAEWLIMKTHPTIGGTILGGSSIRLIQTAAEIALTHHERWDGSGYPAGLRGQEIPITGQIIAIADVFDALTSVRPYKKAWSFEDALAFLKTQTGKHFSPEVVTAFEQALPEITETYRQFQE